VPPNRTCQRLSLQVPEALVREQTILLIEAPWSLLSQGNRSNHVKDRNKRRDQRDRVNHLVSRTSNLDDEELTAIRRIADIRVGYLFHVGRTATRDRCRSSNRRVDDGIN